MTDKDREAFDNWYMQSQHSSTPKRHGDNYSESAPTLFWIGWQAAKADYAPKLTFKEAIEKAGGAVEKLVSRGKYPGDSEFDYALEMAAAALRAAGVRFRNEA